MSPEPRRQVRPRNLPPQNFYQLALEIEHDYSEVPASQRTEELTQRLPPRRFSTSQPVEILKESPLSPFAPNQRRYDQSEMLCDPSQTCPVRSGVNFFANLITPASGFTLDRVRLGCSPFISYYDILKNADTTFGESESSEC